jgi:hypothetical protein
VSSAAQGCCARAASLSPLQCSCCSPFHTGKPQGKASQSKQEAKAPALARADPVCGTPGELSYHLQGHDSGNISEVRFLCKWNPALPGSKRFHATELPRDFDQRLQEPLKHPGKEASNETLHRLLLEPLRRAIQPAFKQATLPLSGPPSLSRGNSEQLSCRTTLCGGVHHQEAPAVTQTENGARRLEEEQSFTAFLPRLEGNLSRCERECCSCVRTGAH